MPTEDDPEEVHRHLRPFTSRHPIPTIKSYEEEKENRRAQGREHAEQSSSHATQSDDVATNGSTAVSHGMSTSGSMQQSAGAEQSKVNGEDEEHMNDTTETGSAARDPKARVKALSQRKDEQAEREVIDPVTHLPVTIQDFTSQALKEVPEDDRWIGASGKTATGLSNKSKSAKQLHKEFKHQQGEHDASRDLYPPPAFDAIRFELQTTYTRGVTIVTAGLVLIVTIMLVTERFLRHHIIGTASDKPRDLIIVAVWIVPALGALAAMGSLIFGMRDWMAKRIDSIWDDEVWYASDQAEMKNAKKHETETVAWLNALLGSVWPLINPDLFLSIADMLEDVMQASLPRMVRMVSVNDIGQGSESVRVLGVRWLPTGAAARSVTEDGQLQGSDKSGQQSNGTKTSGWKEGNNTKSEDQQPTSQQSQQAEDGSQQQVASGLEAEEGDFINMEIAFAYRAKSNKRSLKERAQDMHMYIAFFLPGNLKLAVWVDLRGIVGTMRLRLQLCPDPPFFSLCTITFLGQPKVDISCTPLSKHALNIMDVPFISNFVQSAVDAAMAQYVAPKSLNLDLQDMISGDDFKKDTHAHGIVVVHVKRGYDFKAGDTAIPMIREGSSDPYVSVGWAKFGKPIWSTRLMIGEMQPYWDETASILVNPEEIDVDEKLRLQLWDSDRMTADDDLGRIEVDLKELMEGSQTKGKMMERCDGFKALRANKSMPGKLDWRVGYFAKAPVQACQLKRQTYDPNLRTIQQIRERVDQTCERKLREARTKEGRHRRDADEMDQQNAQEFKRIQDAMMISAPPPDGYPSGIFSIQIHQITGLEVEETSKVQKDKEQEQSDEEEEGEDLPSAYCTVLINHNKVFKTRTKPKNSKPFYNASTERYISDWRDAEVFVAVRDSRVHEDDPLLGIVHLPLSEIFKERSQVNGFYPLAGGVGFGRIRLSMVWRSALYQAPREAIGWDYGTLEIQSEIPPGNLDKALKGAKIKFHTDLGSAKMYPSKDQQSWKSRDKRSLWLPVRKRYSSCMSIQFMHHGMFSDKTSAFATFWLKDLVDEEQTEHMLTVWHGDYERACKNNLPEPGEKVGTMKVRLTFWQGLGSAHRRWAKKDPNVGEVMEILNVARDSLGRDGGKGGLGANDNNDDNSSSSSDDSDGESQKRVDGQGEHKEGLKSKVKGMQKNQEELGRRNRGVMQWKVCHLQGNYCSDRKPNERLDTSHCAVGQAQGGASGFEGRRPVRTPRPHT